MRIFAITFLLPVLLALCARWSGVCIKQITSTSFVCPPEYTKTGSNCLVEPYDCECWMWNVTEMWNDDGVYQVQRTKKIVEGQVQQNIKHVFNVEYFDLFLTLTCLPFFGLFCYTFKDVLVVMITPDYPPVVLFFAMACIFLISYYSALAVIPYCIIEP